MATNVRPIIAQPFRLQYPLNADQVEKIDQMFEILFKQARSLKAGVTAASTAASTATSAVAGILAATDGDANDGIMIPIPGPTGPAGPAGAANGLALMFQTDAEDSLNPMSVGTPQGSLDIAGIVAASIVAGGLWSGSDLTFYGSLTTLSNPTPFHWKTNSNSGDQMVLGSTGVLAVADTNPTLTSLGSGGTYISAINSAASGGFQAASNLTASGSDIGYIDFGTFGTASAEKRVGAIHGFLTAASGASPTGELRFYTTAAGVIAEQLAITSAGKLRFNSTRGVLHSPANNNFTFEANNGSTGFGLQTGTADVMIVANQAQSAYAKVDCLGLKSSGVACPSFGPAAVASITVVNGLITAIS
jgi:hypothetical protein